MNEPSRHCGSAYKVRLQLQPGQDKRGDEARGHLKRVGGVLVEHSVAGVLLLRVQLALQLTHADLHAVGSGAAARLHVAAEEARCRGELPVEDVHADGKTCVELGHFDVEAAALVGGNEAELDFASSRVVCARVTYCKTRSNNGEKRRRGRGGLLVTVTLTCTFTSDCVSFCSTEIPVNTAEPPGSLGQAAAAHRTHQSPTAAPAAG